MTRDHNLSQGIFDIAELIDCAAQREAYRRATELIGPALGRIGGSMPAGAMDGFTAAGLQPAEG